jgi:tRNA A-37 threonylcarbamoyl transferase component Bud32
MAKRVLGGRYELNDVLGRGGMAEVYLGTDRVLSRQVAVKVLAPSFARDENFVARFRREARAAAALNHPNVVGVFDTGSDDGTHFIVMEYIQGKTLAEVIREDAPLLPERAVEIAESVAGGLAFAHAQGIVHRDVKPGNIMLTSTGDVKVMDFGIARATTSDSLTQTATVLGTATYFSPEQAQGAKVDARSDVYSLGCVLYEMLTGQPPFAGESPVAVAYKHVKEDAVPPSRLNSDITSDLDAIVMKALAKNPDNRYQTADEMRVDLHRFRTGEAVTATPLMPLGETALLESPAGTTVMPATATEQAERPRWWVAAAILGGLLLILGVGLFFLARSLLGGGDKLISVADVTGKKVSVARALLLRQGFTIGDVTREFSDQFAQDVVIDYTPKEATKGAAIALVVSKGPKVTLVPVPDVTCEPVGQAVGELQDAGFDPVLAGVASNGACQPGDVAKTDPPGGTEAKEGSTVRVFQVPVPSPSPTTPPPTTPSPSPTTPSPTTPSPTATAIITIGAVVLSGSHRRRRTGPAAPGHCRGVR